jgi:putative flavoprotein involved in K+ transport
MSEIREQEKTIIIGGSQAGLAMSYWLSKLDHDHFILEQNERLAESWRDRWDSFTLVTPNWQLQLPGFAYEGDDPHGFLPREDVVAYVEAYAERVNPPLRLGVEVTGIEPAKSQDGYLVHTSDGTYQADNVIVAVGTFQKPHIPDICHKLPENIAQLHSNDYSNPQALPAGAILVVGGGQSGCQIAQELNEAGREVYLSVSSVGRLPRTYRGKDGMWWAKKLGIYDRTVDQLDSPAERFIPNPRLSGKNGGQEINLHQFAREGITLLGHLEDFQDTTAILAEDLHENLARADQMASEVRAGADEIIEKEDLDLPPQTVEEPRDGFEQDQIRELNLSASGITTVLWATGYEWDFSWIDLPILDRFDYPIQERGITEFEGLYFVGLHYMYTIKSGLFYGVGDDAAHIAEAITGETIALDEEEPAMAGVS